MNNDNSDNNINNDNDNDSSNSNNQTIFLALSVQYHTNTFHALNMLIPIIVRLTLFKSKKYFYS